MATGGSSGGWGFLTGLAAVLLALPADAQAPPVPAPPRAVIFGAASAAPGPAPAMEPSAAPDRPPAPEPPAATNPRPTPQHRVPPASTAAAPAAPAGPESTTATYGAWTLRCISQQPAAGAASPAAPARRCELEQTVFEPGQTRPAAQIAIGADPASGTMRVVVQLPEGAWLPAQPFLSFGKQGPPVVLAYKRCLRGTCLADAAFTDALDAAMTAAAGSGLIGFQMVAGKDIALPVSLDGFAAAKVALEQH